MHRVVARGLGFLIVAAGLLAAPALSQDSSSAPASSEEQSTVPEELQGMVGDWVLQQEDENLPTCALTLTDQQSIGGWAVQIPDACPAPYPAADDLVSWNIDPEDNSVIFLNAERKVTLRLFEDEDGLYDTDPDKQPHFYLLSPIEQDGTGGEADGTD